MAKSRPLTFLDLLLVLVVLGTAAGARTWYLLSYTPGSDASPNAVLQVQGRGTLAADGKTEWESLVASMKENGVVEGYRGQPLFAAGPEKTAHLAPGFALFRWCVEYQVAETIGMNPASVLRWTHLGLGSLTAALYFLIARRTFQSTLIGLLTGLAAALHPYWIINMAELEDGTLVTFLLAVTLWLGIRGGQQGGAVTSLLYGLFLAALALTRAGLLPFAFVGLLWFLWQCRYHAQGWLCAIVAFLGFSIGLSSWTVRNLQTFGEPMPIVSSAWLHTWIGNNPQATGGPFTPEMERTLSAQRLQALRSDLFKTSQTRRYGELRQEVWSELQHNPLSTLSRRAHALKYFFLGAEQPTHAGIMHSEDALASFKEESDRKNFQLFVEDARGCLAWTLFGMLLLAFLGWRWSFAWKSSALLAVAILWIPLPYLLTHAGNGHGLRLPMDGPLLCLAMYALVCLIPGVGYQYLKGEAQNRGSTTTIAA